VVVIRGFMQQYQLQIELTIIDKDDENRHQVTRITQIYLVKEK
jgi:hypothetical protein